MRSTLRACLVLGALMAGVLGLASRDARAQSVVLTCSMNISDVAFGTIDVLSGSSFASNGSLTISCLNVTATTGNLYLCVAIPPRAMTDPSTGSTLAYDMFGPSPATTSWSNTTPIVIPLTALRLNQTYSVNIQAAVSGSQQTRPPDGYTQTLSATANYGSASCTTGLLTGTSSSTFHATASVMKTCNVSASNLAFGPTGNLSSSVTGQSALTVKCSRGTGYSIALDGGLGGATDPTARKMTSGSNSVIYGLYQNAALSVPWGSTSTVAGTGSAGTQSITVYGLVPAQTTPPPGTYSDTIVVTLTY